MQSPILTAFSVSHVVNKLISVCELEHCTCTTGHISKRIDVIDLKLSMCLSCVYNILRITEYSSVYIRLICNLQKYSLQEKPRRHQNSYFIAPSSQDCGLSRDIVVFIEEKFRRSTGMRILSHSSLQAFQKQALMSERRCWMHLFNNPNAQKSVGLASGIFTGIS